ncbi:hypothetical protein QW180_01650 [Vibrio sinaloensis]|nr:hypothetical protein [Vibrio sinaloensis]
MSKSTVSFVLNGHAKKTSY